MAKNKKYKDHRALNIDNSWFPLAHQLKLTAAVPEAKMKKMKQKLTANPIWS